MIAFAVEATCMYGLTICFWEEEKDQHMKK